MPLTSDLRDSYVQFADAKASGSRSLTKSRSRVAASQMNEILFSACKAEEVAWERNGQGDFTLRATQLLQDKRLAFTNQDFVNGVVTAFGEGRKQTPNISCGTSFLGLPLLQPFGGATPAPPKPSYPARDANGAAGSRNFAGVADALESVARELRAL